MKTATTERNERQGRMEGRIFRGEDSVTLWSERPPYSCDTLMPDEAV